MCLFLKILNSAFRFPAVPSLHFTQSSFSYFSMCCLSTYTTPSIFWWKRCTETGWERERWRNRWSLPLSWQPTFSHIRQLSDIIWLAMPGLWKEAHTVLSERQQQQERERATGRDREGRRECFSYRLSGMRGERERAREKVWEDRRRRGRKAC